MSRHPLRSRALWVMLISVAGQVAAFVWGDLVAEELQTTLNSMLDLALIAGLVLSAEKKVTPVADPRDDDGDVLMPVKSNPI